MAATADLGTCPKSPPNGLRGGIEHKVYFIEAGIQSTNLTGEFLTLIRRLIYSLTSFGWKSPRRRRRAEMYRPLVTSQGTTRASLVKRLLIKVLIGMFETL
jgi:hypothetical protein